MGLEIDFQIKMKQKKGEGFDNKQAAFYHGSKGSKLKLSTKGNKRAI